MFTHDEKTTALSTVPGTWPINDTFFPMWASLVAQMVKNLPAMQETWVQSLGSIPGSGRSLGEGNGNPLQDSYLENSMNRGTWWARVHGVTKNWT